MSTAQRSFAFRVATVRGIPIRIHASLALLFAWVAYEEYRARGEPLQEILFVASVLVCVCLHELGHAIAAQWYKIQTRDIVLYPFGGIASILGQPTPVGELVIAIAGPLVNVLIASLLYFLLPQFDTYSELLVVGGFNARLFFANLMLVLFNMIPAYPMDGGRVLRALLEIFKFRSATIFSARLSQLISLLLGGLALYSDNPILVFIAVLIFTQASQELLHNKATKIDSNKTVLEVMFPRENLLCFPHATTLSSAFPSAVQTSQPEFPVLLGDTLVGVVSRDALLAAGTAAVEDQYLAEIMNRDFQSISPTSSLKDLMIAAHGNLPTSLAVVSEGVFCGMLFRDHASPSTSRSTQVKKTFER